MKSSLIQEFSSFHQLIAQFSSEAGASSVLAALYVTSFLPSISFRFSSDSIRFRACSGAGIVSWHSGQITRETVQMELDPASLPRDQSRQTHGTGSQ